MSSSLSADPTQPVPPPRGHRVAPPSAQPRTSRLRRAVGGFTWKKGVLTAALLLLTAVGAVKGYQRYRTPASTTAAVQTVAVSRRTILEQVALPGTVSSGRQAKLSFAASSNGVSVSGTVKSISVKTGDTVLQGQEVARLDTTSLDLAVQSARSVLTVAQLKMQQLIAGSLPSDVASAIQATISASSGVLTAQNTLTTAQTALDTVVYRSNLSTQLVASQQAAESTSLQARTARDAIDAFVTRETSAGADSFALRALSSAITDLVSLVQRRCTPVDVSEACATIASSASDLTSLVTTLNQQAAGTPDLISTLATFNDTATRANAAALRDPMFQLIQATAATPGLQKRVNNLVFAQSGVTTPTPDTVTNAVRTRDAAQQAVDAARTAYTAAVARRDQVISGPLPVEIALQEQSIAQANLTLQRAINDQRGAILFAPFGGVIGAITMNIGEPSGTGSIVFIDPNAMQLQAAAQESDIAKIKVGQTVSLAFDAYVGTTLTGTVSSVAPDATVTQGVASYAVVIAVNTQGGGANAAPGGAGRTVPPVPRATGTPPSGTPTARSTGGTGGGATGAGGASGATPGARGTGGTGSATPGAGAAGTQTGQRNQNIVLRSGMTGTGNIEIQRHTDVLSVPSRAVRRQGRTSVVTVMVDTAQEVRTVQTGVSDTTYTEITSGLNEGDLVVVPSTPTVPGATASGTATQPAGGPPGGAGPFGPR